MSERDDRPIPSDEMLVAFIDGELGPSERAEIEKRLQTEPRVSARLDHLARTDLPFRQAFEPLLDHAPTAKLEAMLAAIPSSSTVPPAQASAQGSRVPAIGRRGFLAAAAACLVAGAVIDRTGREIMRRLSKPDESAEWRAVVAEYLALYTSDTLGGPILDRTVEVEQLSRVGMALGIALSPETIRLQGAEFRRAQVLQYDGQPLAQLAYLDADREPLALCIVASDEGVAKPAQERRRGMNVVYWSDAAHSFMLIGHAPMSQLETLAGQFRGALAA